MFLLNYLAHTKPPRLGEKVVTPSAASLAPPRKGLLARLAVHGGAAVAGVSAIASAGKAGAYEVVDSLKEKVASPTKSSWSVSNLISSK